MSRPACPGCQERDQRIAELEAEIERLRQECDGPDQRDKHRQAHPFRREKGTDEPKKKPGRRKGHAADLRPTPTPQQIDQVIDVPLPDCPRCHLPLYDRGQVVQFQTDLPPIVPIITQFNLGTGYCPGCGEYWQAHHAEQTSDAIGATGNTLGPVVLTMAAEMKHRLGVSYRKICDFLKTYGDRGQAPRINGCEFRFYLTNHDGRPKINSTVPSVRFNPLANVRRNCRDRQLGCILRGVVRRLTRQFVLVSAALLFLGNAGPSCAGMIYIPSFDGSSDDSLQAWRTSSQTMCCADEDNAPRLQLSQPSVAVETIPLQDRCYELLGGQRDCAKTENPAGGASRSDGLHNNQGPQPTTPRPEQSPSGGEYAATGTPFKPSPKDQQVGLAASSVDPVREREEDARFWYLPATSEHRASRFFRPPRHG